MEESGGDSHLLLGLATGSGLGGLGGLGLGGFRGLWIGWGGGAQVSHRDRGAKNPSGSFSAQPRPEMRGVEGLANPRRAHPTADGSGRIVRYGRGAHHLRRYSPSSCKEDEVGRDSGLLFEASGLHRPTVSVGTVAKKRRSNDEGGSTGGEETLSTRIIVVPASLDLTPPRPRTHAVNTHAAETMPAARVHPAKPRATRRPVDPARRRAPFALLVALFAAMTLSLADAASATYDPAKCTDKAAAAPLGLACQTALADSSVMASAAPRSIPGTPRVQLPRTRARRLDLDEYALFKPALAGLNAGHRCRGRRRRRHVCSSVSAADSVSAAGSNPPPVPNPPPDLLPSSRIPPGAQPRRLRRRSPPPSPPRSSRPHSSRRDDGPPRGRR